MSDNRKAALDAALKKIEKRKLENGKARKETSA